MAMQVHGHVLADRAVHRGTAYTLILLLKTRLIVFLSGSTWHRIAQDAAAADERARRCFETSHLQNQKLVLIPFLQAKRG